MSRQRKDDVHKRSVSLKSMRQLFYHEYQQLLLKRTLNNCVWIPPCLTVAPSDLAIFSLRVRISQCGAATRKQMTAYNWQTTSVFSLESKWKRPFRFSFQPFCFTITGQPLQQHMVENPALAVLRGIPIVAPPPLQSSSRFFQPKGQQFHF